MIIVNTSIITNIIMNNKKSSKTKNSRVPQFAARGGAGYPARSAGAGPS